MLRAIFLLNCILPARAEPPKESPLIEAAASGSAESVRRLLDQGADVNAVNAAGETPLMKAVASVRPFHFPPAKEISAWGKREAARREATDRLVRSLTAEHPDSSAKSELERLKRERDSDPVGQLMLGAQLQLERGLELVRLLLERKAAVNVSDKRGHTPLGLAVLGNHARIVSELLAHGADPNAKDRAVGSTPLILAVQLDNLNAVNALLDRGADVGGRDESGRTALAAAKTMNDPEIVRRLTAAGAKQ